MIRKTKFFYFIILSILISVSSCKTAKPQPKNELWSIQESLLYDAYSMYVDSIENLHPMNKKITIHLYNKAIMDGCFTYGMAQLAFYYGFIDTTSFPHLAYGIEMLDYFEGIQKLTKDTIALDCNKFFVNRHKEKLKCFDSKTEFQKVNDSGFTTITPLIPYLNNRYLLYVNSYGHRTTEGTTIIYNYINGKLKIVEINRTDDGDMIPCAMAPDSLRTVDFDRLRAPLEGK